MSTKGDNTFKGNSSASTNAKIEELFKKVERLEHENVVLEDKVKSYEDPNRKVRIIPKGFVQKGAKFEKNNIRVEPIVTE